MLVGGVVVENHVDVEFEATLRSILRRNRRNSDAGGAASTRDDLPVATSRAAKSVVVP